MNVFLYKTPDLNTQGLFTAWSLSSHTPLVSLIETTSGHGLIIRRFGVQVPVGPPSKPLVYQGVFHFSQIDPKSENETNHATSCHIL